MEMSMIMWKCLIFGFTKNTKMQMSWKPNIFSSNKINNLLYIKDYSMTKKSLLEDVTFNRLKIYLINVTFCKSVYIYTCGVSAKVTKQISKFCTYILLPY